MIPKPLAKHLTKGGYLIDCPSQRLIGLNQSSEILLLPTTAILGAHDEQPRRLQRRQRTTWALIIRGDRLGIHAAKAERRAFLAFAIPDEPLNGTASVGISLVCHLSPKLASVSAAFIPSPQEVGQIAIQCGVTSWLFRRRLGEMHVASYRFGADTDSLRDGFLRQMACREVMNLLVALGGVVLAKLSGCCGLTRKCTMRWAKAPHRQK